MSVQVAAGPRRTRSETTANKFRALNVVIDHDTNKDLDILKAKEVISEDGDGRRITPLGHRFLAFLFSKTQNKSTFVFKPSQSEIFDPLITQIGLEMDEDMYEQLGEDADQIISDRVDICFARGRANFHLLWWLYEGFEGQAADREPVTVGEFLTDENVLLEFINSPQSPKLNLNLDSKVFNETSKAFGWTKEQNDAVKSKFLSPWPDKTFNAFMGRSN